MHHLLVTAGAYASAIYTRNRNHSRKGGKPGRSLRVRTRKSIFEMHNELGPGLFRRAFRMHLEHRRSHVRLGNGYEDNSLLPRELLHEQILEQDLKRPV